MNRDLILCRTVMERPSVTQRELAQELNLSLGTVNGLVKDAIQSQLITQSDNGLYHLLPKGDELLLSHQVDGALIIAAGFGSRFVPLTFETPKGLLEVFGERMIERQIRQLHEAGITDITIAVGYLKEKFEYLIDKYQVKLLYNPEYSCKNTLATIYHAKDTLKGKNMYLLSSDNWLRHNMYHHYEGDAWYSSAFMKGQTSEWCLHFNKKGQIQSVTVGGEDSWVMYGPAYFSREFSDQFLPVLEAYYHLPGTEQFYWENVLKEMLSGETAVRLPNLPQAREKILIDINRRPENEVYEFENLEELRQFDVKYQHHSDNQAMELLSQVFQVPESEITEIRCLKSGMTNKSFLFKVNGTHYICRIPGPGTELLINRSQEKAAYDAVAPLKLTETIIYFNGENGYKIAKYYDGARNARADSEKDMKACMAAVRRLHNSGLTVEHSFDFRERIDFYAKLCKSQGNILFEDYPQVYAHMSELMDKLDKLNHPKVLSHLDDNVDNFLVLPDGSIRLIDWEYAGMCDPLADVAMCAIYSYYSKEQADRLMEIYLEQKPTAEERFSVYAYMALGGFLWSLWAVYKASLGDEFGEYTLIMYRYAKEYYKKCCEIEC
ncbi:MAG TPA: phosphotransferase [Candidatus Hungatella pullicola]|nr:phosphotransferase [Candidatus Hungatella pullicola]